MERRKRPTPDCLTSSFFCSAWIRVFTVSNGYKSMADTTPPIAPAVQERERFENPKRVEDFEKERKRKRQIQKEARALKRTR